LKDSIKNLDIYKNFISSPYYSTKHLSYFDTYQDIFSKYRNKPITFVEIGILDGGSLFMWRDFFGKKARIIGIEFNPDAKKWTKHGFEVFIGSQSDQGFWDNFYKKVGMVDVVLDDGGHTNEQQIVTAVKSIPFIKDNGILVVEDTHSSYMTKFGNPYKYSFIEWSKKLIDNVNSRSKGIEISKLIYNKYVHSIRFFESIVCFEINRKKSINSYPVTNNKKSCNTKDFKLKGTSLEKARFKSKFRFWLYFRIKSFAIKRFFR
jgi:hypothetical protein